MTTSRYHPTHAPLAALAIAAMALSACSLGAGGAQKTAGRPFADGETLGGETTVTGTPTAAQVHTLLSVSCERSALVIRTSVESITATSDCTKAPLEAELDRALGLPATISRAGDTLRITNPSGGTINIEASDVTVSDAHAAP